MGEYSAVKGKRKVFLFFPKLSPQKQPLSPGETEAPLSMLALGRQFLNGEYQLEIYDSRVDTNYEERISRISPELLCVGVSCMSGYQVVDGYNFSKFVKENFPQIPIIWGGWHPSLLPEQCLQSKYVDIVVRGQGEVPLLEVVNHLNKDAAMDNIKGISTKTGQKIVHTPLPPVTDLNDLRPLNYDLLNVSKYTISQGILNYISSIGCAYQCTFCGVSSVFNCRWYPLSDKRVIDELDFLYHKYHLKKILFYDSIFFMNTKRAKSILKGLIKKGINIRWEAAARVDLISRFSQEEFDLIKESNCDYIHFGIESASQRILNMYKKDFKKEMIEKTFLTLAENNIPVNASYIIAPPTETKEEFWETLKSIEQCLTINKKNVVRIFKYTPIPGTELYNRFEKGGATRELEDWSNLYKSRVVNINNPYLYKNDEINRAPILFYFHLVFRSSLRQRVNSKSIIPLFLKLILSVAEYRWHRKRFVFPFEWYFYKWYKSSKLRSSSY